MKQQLLKIADDLIRLHTDGEASSLKVTLHNRLVRLAQKAK